MKLLQSSHTLVSRFDGEAPRGEGHEQGDVAGVYKTPVKRPVMIFDDSEALLDWLGIKPLIGEIARNDLLKDEEGVQIGIFPSENPFGSKNEFYQQVAFEVDRNKNVMTVEHENGHYAVGMICVPLVEEAPEATGGKWIISEAYIADSSMISSIELTADKHNGAPLMSEIVDLVLRMNKGMATMASTRELSDNSDAWDDVSATFTGQVVDIAQKYSLLKSSENGHTPS